jgi:hypothetical protein
MTTETMTPAATPSEGISAPATVGSTPAPAAPEPQRVTIVETPKPSLDDELSSLYDKINAPEEKKPEPHSKTVAEALALDAEPELPLEDPITDPPKETPSEPDKTPAIAAPNSWSTEQKAKWDTLPPETRAYIAEREKDAHAKITQQGNELRTYQPYREINEHIRTQFGVPAGREAEVVVSWARAQQALDANPVEGLKWLAQSYKVDLAQLAGTPPAPKTDAEAIDDLFRDPRLDRVMPEVKSEVNELRQQVMGLTRQLQARTHAEQLTQAQQVEKIIQTFSADKEHWADVEEDVAHEIDIIRKREPHLSYEKILEQAYDRAIHANAATRARILEDQQRKAAMAQEAAKKQAAEEAAKKAAQAKKVQSMNVRTGATASTPTYDGKWDDKDKLTAIYDRIQTGSR